MKKINKAKILRDKSKPNKNTHQKIMEFILC